MQSIQFLSSCILLFLTLTACHLQEGTSNSAEQLLLDKKGREDFNTFHEKFFNEIQFQLSRIEFPVMGPDKENGIPSFIEEKDWKILRPIQKDDPNIKRQIVYTADDLIEEFIVVRQAFVIKIRYTLDQATNRWLLTYYSGIKDPQLRPTADERFLDSSRTTAIIDSTFQE